MVANYEAGLADDDLMGMVDAEEIGIEWEDERPNNITAEKLEQWVKGEITWAQGRHHHGPSLRFCRTVPAF